MYTANDLMKIKKVYDGDPKNFMNWLTTEIFKAANTENITDVTTKNIAKKLQGIVDKMKVADYGHIFTGRVFDFDNFHYISDTHFLLKVDSKIPLVSSEKSKKYDDDYSRSQFKSNENFERVITSTKNKETSIFSLDIKEVKAAIKAYSPEYYRIGDYVINKINMNILVALGVKNINIPNNKAPAWFEAMGGLIIGVITPINTDSIYYKNEVNKNNEYILKVSPARLPVAA